MATRASDLLNTNYTKPYSRYLKKKFNLPIDKSEVTPAANHLQQLHNAGNKDGYREAKRHYEREEKKRFRLTDNVVTETTGVEEYTQVPVMVQVKGYSITWYFVLHPKYKDRYPQEFRDILYQSAAQAHQHVTRGCDLYYRGSNAYHVKSMHTNESEAAWNHNHYRMADNSPVTDFDFTQHMMGFSGTEANLPNATKEGSFFEPGELEEICRDYQQWYRQWTYTGLDRPVSYEEQYMTRPENQLNKIDVIEFYLFGQQQEPCRINPSELKQDYEKARQLITERYTSSTPVGAEQELELKQELLNVEKEYLSVLKFREIGGSRGLSSELANVRQIEGSSLKSVPLIPEKDDALEGGVPQIPEWAVHARENMLHTLELIKQSADLTTNPSLEKEISEFADAVSQKEKASKVESDLSGPDNSPALIVTSVSKGTMFSHKEKDTLPGTQSHQSAGQLTKSPDDTSTKKIP
ncbi:hypothetical protein [Legionella sp. W05-934-2]|jgi:hypothetical protein|uniref:hypothetical protein n=1 Tax=Legionella sp. W05-934-2 TaxID=1198649 RepID=UPI003461CB33